MDNGDWGVCFYPENIDHKLQYEMYSDFNLWPHALDFTDKDGLYTQVLIKEHYNTSVLFSHRNQH